MAAGDIIIPDNTITPEILDQIASEVQNRLSQTAKDPNDWEEVSSLVGVSSLPVFQVSGSVYKLVRVALSVLKGVDGSDGQDGQDGEDGVDGKTPQITIGTVTNGDTASATLTADGVDDNGNPKFKLNLVLPKGDKGDTGATGETGAPGAQGDPGKTVKMGTVTVTSGQTPSGSFTQNGTDGEGNPIYDLSLVVQKGDNGKDPVFEQGTTTTLDPSAEAYVEVVPNGVTEDGNPKYTLNFGVPRGVQGAAGTGSGNVYVPGTGLQSGKTYLFKPDTDGSTTGTFVEYTVPEIPEQVQPDWNATEGKGAILNKPVIPNVPDWALQPNKPTYTADEVGALTDAPNDGKTYGRKDGVWSEVNLDNGFYLLNMASLMEEGATFSQEDFNKLKNAIISKKAIIIYSENIDSNWNNAICPAGYIEEDDMIVIYYNMSPAVTVISFKKNSPEDVSYSITIESFVLSTQEDIDELKQNVLTKNNTTSYSPTLDYHPSTKKYVDDNMVNVVKDASYVHTDNNYSDEEKQKVSDSLRLKEYTDVTNISSLPATPYNLRYAYSSNSPKAINFSSVSSVPEMQEFYLSIKNNTSVTITQPIPNGSGWQSDEASIEIEAGKTAGVSIKKEHGIMVVRV